MSRRLLSAAAGVAAAIALAVVPAAAASAHDYLVSSDPAADSTVSSAVPTVSLTFNDRVLDLGGDGSGSLLTVTGPDGAGTHFETGCPTIADTVVSAPVALGSAGQYTVSYQVVSADGHTVSDSYSFRYTPPAGTAAAAGSPSSPCGATATPSATPEPTMTTQAGATPGPTATATASTPQPTQAAGSGNVGLVIGIAVAIVVLAIAGVLIVVLTARRKPPAGPADAGSGDASRED